MSATNHVNVYRCRCRACARPYAVLRFAGDVRGAPATDAPCATCIGSTTEFQAAHYVM